SGKSQLIDERIFTSTKPPHLTAHALRIAGSAASDHQRFKIKPLFLPVSAGICRHARMRLAILIFARLPGSLVGAISPAQQAAGCAPRQLRKTGMVSGIQLLPQ